MILVFCSVFVFLLGCLKIFRHADRLKKFVLATIFFSASVSFVVSFLSVYGFYGAYDTDEIEVIAGRYNPTLAQFSLPFYLEVDTDATPYRPPTKLGERLYFAGVQLWETEFGIRKDEGRLIIHPPDQPDVNYTIPLFYHLLLIFTALNIIGAPLAAFTYKLTEKITKK